jgi:hypothetical protein
MITTKVRLKQITPLLMHADNIEWADKMQAWQLEPDNKGKSKAGDDRTPPWRWIGCLNHDEGIVTIPSEYIMSSILGGAAQVPLKGKQTFKSLSQSGLLCGAFHWPLFVNGKTISMAAVEKCTALKTFRDQIDAAKDLGFSLFVKRAWVGTNKHVRVRPQFDQWSSGGEITIISEEITPHHLKSFLAIAGKTKGLGDWRPGSPKRPGPWGMYEAEVEVSCLCCYRCWAYVYQRRPPRRVRGSFLVCFRPAVRLAEDKRYRHGCAWPIAERNG